MLLLLLAVSSNTLVRAQEPEAMLWALINNHIKLLTQPMLPQVKVRSSCVGLGCEWHVCGSNLFSGGGLGFIDVCGSTRDSTQLALAVAAGASCADALCC